MELKQREDDFFFIFLLVFNCITVKDSDGNYVKKETIDLLKELDVKLANRRKSDKSYLHWE